MGFLFWSWLAFALPMQQQNAANTIQKKVSSEKVVNGVASYYHNKFVGRPTATGETFSNEGYTAASNFFKLGTFVKVTNKRNGKFIYVKINDRMGHPSRVIDLTERAARDLGYFQNGITKVTIETVSYQEGRRQILAQQGEDMGLPDGTM